MNASVGVAFLVLCVCVTACAWEANFAENPSAEEDLNRDGLPDGWVPGAFKSPAKLAWDKDVAHTGKASLRISDSKHPTGTAWDENTGRWSARSRRPVTPGEKYTLGAWIKTNGVTGKATACIAWWNDQKWLAESYTKPVTGTSDWQWATVTAAAPAKATAGQIYLNLGSSAGTAWFDDISMTKGDRLPGNYRPVDISAACNTGFTD